MVAGYELPQSGAAARRGSMPKRSPRRSAPRRPARATTHCPPRPARYARHSLLRGAWPRMVAHTLLPSLLRRQRAERAVNIQMKSHWSIKIVIILAIIVTGMAIYVGLKWLGFS